MEAELAEVDDDLCAYEYFPKTFHQPAEYCSLPVEPGSEWCSDHDPTHQEPDWDSIRDDRAWRFDD
jgi:hypothetical protein